MGGRVSKLSDMHLNRRLKKLAGVGINDFSRVSDEEKNELQEMLKEYHENYNHAPRNSEEVRDQNEAKSILKKRIIRINNAAVRTLHESGGPELHLSFT